MSEVQAQTAHGLEEHGIVNPGNVYRNLTTAALYEESIRRREGLLSHLGPLVVRTGQHTGRSPRDKYVVDDATTHERVWWGESNQPLPPERFDTLFHRLLAYLQGKDVFVQDLFADADPAYRMPIRVITERAWHSLFARNLFIRPEPGDLKGFEPRFTVIQVPGFTAVPEVDGTRSGVFVVLNFSRRLVLIGGTSYAGEIKKSVFTVLNYLLPQEQVLSMHCSANVGQAGDVALFFGLSGTGKTTLSADPERSLIGDDEHGWSDRGIFNFEGGCYAKVIRLSPEAEPQIYRTTRTFGTVLENVAIDAASRRIDLDDDSLTENTRAAYPITHIPGAVRSGTGDHPKTVIFLSADAFGVLPPIARLSPEQAMYYFLSGYTAKVAGTEKGVKEPQATFSSCFGAPFMALHPEVYARLLGEKIARHGVGVWLVNTGWTGGPYGTGHRMPIAHTRAMVKAALTGALDGVPVRTDPFFGLQVPERVPGVPPEALDVRSTWSDPEAYDAQARKLAGMFAANFEPFASAVPEAVRQAGPRA
ncbi:phosphoenolpyruvate carboxykinase [Limnochorda pilosa]|uniref:Phosphoenolpyruvate carboxykinase (ATP) n=1 Tax=Limnochorda pilosa TaxID=1555112 RepID=A0A0K2SN25_LIMPI|nr:phosphoenolpyruvate carboxykinase [Limnochorda pilosa]BAS28516.1 phosphoenolpyruvate carboxykinase [Limnochorda pilosa]